MQVVFRQHLGALDILRITAIFGLLFLLLEPPPEVWIGSRVLRLLIVARRSLDEGLWLLEIEKEGVVARGHIPFLNSPSISSQCKLELGPSGVAFWLSFRSSSCYCQRTLWKLLSLVASWKKIFAVRWLQAGRKAVELAKSLSFVLSSQPRVGWALKRGYDLGCFEGVATP